MQGGTDETPPVEAHVSESEALKRELDALGSRPVVTPVLIVANVVVFGAMVASGVGWFEPKTIDIVTWGGNVGGLTLNGEWWRLASCMFVHIGIIHIAMNMAVLFDAGRMVERLVGHAGFLAMYAVSGLVGSVASLVWNPNVVSAGASGAVFGVFGGLLGLLARDARAVPGPLRNRLAKLAAVFVGYNLLFGLGHEGIDMAAHIGGLLGGFACGFVLALPIGEGTPARRRVRAAIVAVAGLVAVGAAAVSLPAPSGPPVLIDEDQRVAFGASEVYFRGDAERADAKRLGEHLKQIGFFQKGRPATVVLTVQGGEHTVGFVVREGVADDPEMLQGFRAVGVTLSVQVFGGEPVVVALLDDRLGVVRELEPADIDVAEQSSNQPEFLFGLEIDALARAPVVREHADAIRSLLERELFAELPASCGWPLVGELRQILVRHYRAAPEGYLVVVRGMPRASFDACVGDLAGGGDAVSLAHDGSDSELRIDGLVVALRWLDADSFLFEIEPGALVPTPVADRERLAARVTERVGYDGSEALAVAADRVDDAAMWTATVDPAGRVRVDVGDDVRFDLRLFFREEREATFVMGFLRDAMAGVLELDSVRPLRDKFTVATDGGTVSIRATFTDEELVEAVGRLAADDEFMQLWDSL